jgi:dTMP kinase
MPRGLFLSLDGLDGSGKSTQCRLLADWLRAQGQAVTLCHDPGGTAVGDVLRQLLLHHTGHIALPAEALLFMASRAQLIAEVIRPSLDAGQTVVCDRYLLANVVYQGHAGGLDPERLRDLGRFAADDLLPDLTIVLDLPVSLASARRNRKADRLESRGDDFQERVRAGFLEEGRRQPVRIAVIDASGERDTVQEAIRREAARVVATHPRP